MNNVLGFLEAKLMPLAAKNGPAASSWGHSWGLRFIHAVYHRRLHPAGDLLLPESGLSAVYVSGLW